MNLKRKRLTVDHLSAKERTTLGWSGTICLFSILLIKLLRLSVDTDPLLIVGIAPSILGPPGVLFLILSSNGRLSRLSPMQATFITGAVAIGLELLQLLPRPGILARVNYTFDFLDLIASLLSLVVAYFAIRGIVGKSDPMKLS